MAIFDKYINNCSRLDWRILINGSIALYSDMGKMKDDIKWLKNEGFVLVFLDFDNIDSESSFHSLIKEKLKFPEYYGENMSSLNDCLLHDLNIPNNSGIVFIFINIDHFLNKYSNIIYEILDIMDMNSRRHLLTGERFITLINSCNSDFALAQIGSHQIYTIY